jgi:hypothetical protein
MIKRIIVVVLVCSEIVAASQWLISEARQREQQREQPTLYRTVEFPLPTP